MDLVIENLTMEGSNILPNIISVDAHNYLEFSPYDAIPDHDNHDFKFTFSQMQADMRDVAFYFNKKSGLPKLKDSGLADVFLGGEGLTVTVHLTGAGKDTSSVFKVKDVHVKVDSLKFSVRDVSIFFRCSILNSRVLMRDAPFRPSTICFTRLLSPSLLVLSRSRSPRPSRTPSALVWNTLMASSSPFAPATPMLAPIPTSAQLLRSPRFVHAFFLYLLPSLLIITFLTCYQMFERQQADVQSKAESTKAKTGTFKVVNKRDSVIVNEGHESGWINKVADRDAAVQSGEGWKSSAFNIVPGGAGGAGVPASHK